MSLLTESNRAIYERLFALADRFGRMQPWTFMDEEDTINVLDPISEEISQCVIMGSLEEVMGLAVYVGKAGQAVYESIMAQGSMFYDPDDDDLIPPEWLLYLHRTLKLELVHRDEVDDATLGLYKDLGLSYRRKMSSPVFARMQPGYLPETNLTDAELLHLADCLEQTLKVVEMVEVGGDPFPENYGERWYIRKRSDGGRWSGTTIDSPFVDPWSGFPENTLPPGLVEFTEKETRRGRYVVGLLLLPLPVPVMEDRPFFPLILLFLDMRNGKILHQETFSPVTFETEFHARLCAYFRSRGSLPGRIVAGSFATAGAVSLSVEALGIKMEVEPEMEIFHGVMASILGQFGGGFMDLEDDW